MSDTPTEVPKWVGDIASTLGVHSQYVMWGNVRDLHLVPGPNGPVPVDTVKVLTQVLNDRGIPLVLVHDPVTGVDVIGDESLRAAASELTGLALGSGPVPVTLAGLSQVIRRMVENREHNAALIVPYASRLAVDASNLQAEEHEFFVAMERLSRSATPRSVDGGPPLHNPVFWLLSQEQDFPHWVSAGNDQLRTVVIPQPDLGQRRAMGRFTLRIMGTTADDHEIDEALTALAGATESMSLRAVRDCIRLASSLELPVTEMEDAVRCYRVGVADNPWRRGYLRQRISDGEAAVGERVLGQEAAITSTFDILKRSVMGLSGAHTSGQGGRPRGILFFAGPTGVGKTELAKAITNVVFGDDSAYLRFDMSEYSAEQAEARFVGAPPGFVGYDAGGQLTNAVRQKPFSLLLFDEIEKGHPRILDKFLQILEDGRLTDGRGGTVHFSETLIVFTSNLGIYHTDSDGVRRPIVDESVPYEEMASRVRRAVSDHFVQVIGRPELLNRIGENIVVFSFITEDVARRIFDLQLANVEKRIRHEHGVELAVDQQVRDRIRSHCIEDRSLGGRGIGNQVEALLVNPLARAIFTRADDATTITVRSWSLDDGVARIELE